MDYESTALTAELRALPGCNKKILRDLQHIFSNCQDRHLSCPVFHELLPGSRINSIHDEITGKRMPQAMPVEPPAYFDGKLEPKVLAMQRPKAPSTDGCDREKTLPVLDTHAPWGQSDDEAEEEVYLASVGERLACAEIKEKICWAG